MLHPVVLLDSEMSLEAVLARLQVHEGARYALIRQQCGARLTWHALTVGELRAGLGGSPLDTILRDVGSIDLTGPGEKTLQVTEATPRRLSSFRGVLLEVETVIALAAPDPRPRLRTSPERAGGGGRSGSAGVFRGRGQGATYKPPRGAGEGYPGEPHVDRLESGWEEITPTRAPPPPPPLAPVPGAALDAGPVLLRAFPAIQAPRTVASGDRFDAEVGLAEAPLADVHGMEVIVRDLPEGTTEVELDLQLAADGFTVDGGRWRHKLLVPLADVAANRVLLHLVAPQLQANEPERLGYLLVHFSYKGIPCGMASKPIVTLARGAASATDGGAGLAWADLAPSAPLVVPADSPPPDLTIRIARPDGNDARGRFALSFDPSPHPIELPDAPFVVDLGDDSDTFARFLVQQVEKDDGRALVDNTVSGIGTAIADVLPPELWDVLRRLWEVVRTGEGRAPTVLLLSAEPHVPWELAYMPDAPDPARPPYLGAQFSIGRWILGRNGPPVPPAHAVAVSEMAVVTGNYESSPGITELPHAIREGGALVARYGAIPVPMREREVKTLLDGKLRKGGAAVRVEAVHFACHGEASPGSPLFDRLIFEDQGRSLSPVQLRSARLGGESRPLMFLNACQVGSASELLGGYWGFAMHSLLAGFRGFVAPLWSVNDDLAGQIALEFYERAFGDEGAAGVPVAEILRDIRARYDGGADPAYTTPLAYVFYGHPRLVLTRPKA